MAMRSRVCGNDLKARVQMNISVDQMCDMQISPIACLFEQSGSIDHYCLLTITQSLSTLEWSLDSNVNFVFSERSSETVADSHELPRPLGTSSGEA